jgi:hypothetical protein
MKNYIGTGDLAIWISLIVGRLFLCLLVFKKNLFNRVPWFSLYIVVSSSESILLFVLAFFSSYATYYYVFYLTNHIVSLLAFLTLIESGRRILPGLNLPQKEKALALLLAALAGVMIFAIYWPMRYVEKRIDLAAYLTIATGFIFVAAYSRYLGLYWSRFLAGISSALGLLYLAQGATRAITGHFPLSVALLARQANQLANVLAVIAWIIVVLSPWGESVMTEEDLQILEAAFAKIEGSLGTERIKIV